MLGYIVPEKPELKLKEYDIYSSYYCGICKSIGIRFGQLPRLSLSYDSVFLALILATVYDLAEVKISERCIVHPVKQKPFIKNNVAVDYAADMHLVLMYYKLLDDYRDEHHPGAAVGAAFMKRTWKKLALAYPEKCRIIRVQLDELSAIEKAKTPSIDKSSEPFAKIMETIFSQSLLSEEMEVPATMLVLSRVGYHIGKWLYLIDAFDDLEDNAKSGAYNPLIYQFDFGKNGQESITEFRERIKERVEFNLVYYLAELSKAFDLLDIRKNKELIENIIYLGLLRKTEQVIMKGSIKTHAQSI
jgi:hypothetical protein